MPLRHEEAVMKRTILLLSVLVLLLISVFAAQVFAVQIAATPDSLPPKAIELQDQPLPLLAAPNLRLPQQSTLARPHGRFDEISHWSAVVYQSFRDGNWEIYQVNPESNAADLRLTAHGAADIQPRLNRGGTHIVFASNRTGNYELFKMKRDGSGLTQLTYTAADEFNPIWSPDGLEIAFQRYDGKQTDLYVMTAHGVQTRRLTTDPAFDGMPSWSPDGDQIAFASTRLGIYGLWLMDADGGNQRLLVSKAYIENPAWSPDGTRIAYDADGNGDGFQEVWVINVDGSQDYLKFSSYNYTDFLARGWSPDGSNVTATKIVWIFYEGNWYWIEARIYGGGQELTSGDLNLYPDWQTLDAQAPVSWLEPLPVFSRQDVEISWDAIDQGNSGIDRFDIQYRLGSQDNWVEWMSIYYPTYRTFEMIPGETVYFRVRANDHALNQEEWSVYGADTSTTFYNWAISGTVRDNAGTVLAGASVNTTPAAFRGQTTDNDGAYHTLVADSSASVLVNWTKEGYGTLPDITFPGYADAEFDVVLPPHKSELRDWGFEVNELEESAWTSGGIITPALTSLHSHTGDRGAVIGQAYQFEPTVEITSSDEFIRNLNFVFSKSGHGHLTWTSGPDSNLEHYYAEQTESGWTNPISLSSGYYTIKLVELAVCDSGTVHLVALQGGQYDTSLQHRWRNLNGEWQPWTEIHPEGRLRYLDCDMQGNLHAIWSTSDGPYYRQLDPAGNWSATESVTGSAYLYTAFALAPDGSVHLAYPSNDQIFYVMRSSSGQWTAPEPLGSSEANVVTAHSLVATRDGQVHLTFQQIENYEPGFGYVRHIYYTKRDKSGMWSTPTNIGQMPIAWGCCGNPGVRTQVIIDDVDQEVIHVVFMDHEKTGLYHVSAGTDGSWSDPELILAQAVSSVRLWAQGNELFILLDSYNYSYMRLANDGTWSGPWPMDFDSGDIGRPAMDDSGNLHVFWTKGFSTGGVTEAHLYYAGTEPLAQPSVSTLSQRVMVPEEMSNPVLSLHHQLNDPAPADLSRLQITIADDLTETIVFSSSIANSPIWTHDWVDVSAWRGQTVTVTLATRQPAGLARGWVYLDEVTLGSAYPDLWIQGCKPLFVGPDQEFSCAIALGNRSDIDAANGILTMTLPAELEQVTFNPAPTTMVPHPTWELGSLSADGSPITVIMTATVVHDAPLFAKLPVEFSLSSQTPEQERWNNQTEFEVIVGYRTLLPVLARAD